MSTRDTQTRAAYLEMFTPGFTYLKMMGDCLPARIGEESGLSPLWHRLPLEILLHHVFVPEHLDAEDFYPLKSTSRAFYHLAKAWITRKKWSPSDAIRGSLTHHSGQRLSIASWLLNCNYCTPGTKHRISHEYNLERFLSYCMLDKVSPCGAAVVAKHMHVDVLKCSHDGISTCYHKIITEAFLKWRLRNIRQFLVEIGEKDRISVQIATAVTHDIFKCVSFIDREAPLMKISRIVKRADFILRATVDDQGFHVLSAEIRARAYRRLTCTDIILALHDQLPDDVFDERMALLVYEAFSAPRPRKYDEIYPPVSRKNKRTDVHIDEFARYVNRVEASERSLRLLRQKRPRDFIHGFVGRIGIDTVPPGAWQQSIRFMRLLYPDRVPNDMKGARAWIGRELAVGTDAVK